MTLVLMMCGSITCCATSQEGNRSLGVGSMVFRVANMEGRASLLVPGCSQNCLEYSTSVSSTV